MCRAIDDSGGNTYQGACEVDAGRSRAGAVEPLRFGESEEPVTLHRSRVEVVADSRKMSLGPKAAHMNEIEVQTCCVGALRFVVQAGRSQGCTPGMAGDGGEDSNT